MTTPTPNTVETINIDEVKPVKNPNNVKVGKNPVTVIISAEAFNNYKNDATNVENLAFLKDVPENRHPHIKQLLALITTAYHEPLPLDLSVAAAYVSGTNRYIAVNKNSFYSQYITLFSVKCTGKNKYTLLVNDDEVNNNNTTKPVVTDGYWSKEIKPIVRKILTDYSIEHS